MIALDVHAHLIPADAERLAGLPGVIFDGGTMTIDGAKVGIKALFQPEALIAWMDERGVARALVSAPPPTYRQHLDAADAAAWCAYLNDGLAAICARWPDRLQPLFHVPVEHADLAVEIVRTRGGGAGFSLAAGGDTAVCFSDAALEPLWQVLNARKAFVFLHPGHCADERQGRFYLENLLGNPCETAIAVGHLVFGGVLARHADVRFCLAHAGGVTAMVAGRWQQGFDTARPGVDTGLPPPRAQLRRFTVDTIAHDPAALALAAEVFGPDNIRFGSDWPFPMGLLDPAKQLPTEVLAKFANPSLRA